jgi:hypothetical protein
MLEFKYPESFDPSEYRRKLYWNRLLIGIIVLILLILIVVW